MIDGHRDSLQRGRHELDPGSSKRQAKKKKKKRERKKKADPSLLIKRTLMGTALERDLCLFS